MIGTASIAALWIVAGGAFFIAIGQHSGWPERWSAAASREVGWSDLLFVYLPFCLVGGPLWWIAFVIYRVATRVAR